ncbi:biotin/lipoate--protein ligase family protein [Sedimentitalea nanhaiensis]|uniref:Biotin-(Acetyl-CoA carboxylase) ligase n=1 Tax=Sedimentitalea nanhaiensis TaxID=999627 RepID=A0A1I7ASU1_9RHOB|nr:biotin/lipoate--protein ligase family protein [Sedimentitalea nanhaiensis]SFT77984.1 Biotin-(acetyl-CoA carboxylase) ligase [Sedimentitalea nanhaiensis]
MTEAPRFPPLLRGVAAGSGEDPFEKACAMAALGCDGGTLVYSLMADRLRAALVFAPEVPLEDAMAMVPVCGVGFQNALGALAPPEVAVQLTWDGGIRVNGAGCGFLQARASRSEARAVPEWLVVGIEISLMQTETDPGANPDVTALHDEGCADMGPNYLLEGWARHTLVWINRWGDEGNASLHDQWMGLLVGVGEPIERAGVRGVFLGVDEKFGMLIRDNETTHLVPLSSLAGEPT